MKFADPKNDLAFKKIFGNENKKEILISFLNSVLDFKEK
ncbi:MAG: PD-(D/E)XK nuclease family transposase, partial [Campylobacterota bacterium]|nr:PD-(D/E)XK nuclease family transposase [Campylobacterota bacterium]